MLALVEEAWSGGRGYGRRGSLSDYPLTLSRRKKKSLERNGNCI